MPTPGGDSQRCAGQGENPALRRRQAQPTGESGVAPQAPRAQGEVPALRRRQAQPTGKKSRRRQCAPRESRTHVCPDAARHGCAAFLNCAK
eukprot:4380316-Alexandrium_andersonii.AAC.1